MTEPLRIAFSFDKASGLFFGELENGARFAVDRHSIGGNLARNLLLYRDAVLAELKDEPFRPTVLKKRELTPGEVTQLPYLGPKRKPPPKLLLSELDLEDLEL